VELAMREFNIDKSTALTDVKSVLLKLYRSGLIVKVEADGYYRYCIPYATATQTKRVG
jgi:hypothetical protein